MKEINDHNIDDIMFRLLEGDIQGEERKRLLEAIESDAAYSKLWKAWQHTILEPDTNIPGMNLSSLKKNGGRIIPFHFKYAIAAMVVLGLGVAIFMSSRKEPDTQVQTDHNTPYTRKAPVEVPKPKPSPYTGNTEDTIVPLREKIKTIAENRKETLSTPVPPAPIVKTPETPKESEQVIVKKDPEHTEITPPTIKSNEKEPVIADNIVVSVSSAILSSDVKQPEKKRGSLFSRLFGNPSIEIQKDSTLITNRRVVIKNKQFQILAGY